MTMNEETNKEYVYIADNTQKDFVTPNKLGWTTICLLDNGHNIHKQNFELSKEYLPQFRINSFEEIILTND
jgi:putative hydrolase of the HAD superfamily